MTLACPDIYNLCEVGLVLSCVTQKAIGLQHGTTPLSIPSLTKSLFCAEQVVLEVSVG